MSIVRCGSIVYPFSLDVCDPFLPFSRRDALRLQLLPTPASTGRRRPRRTSLG
ncbi:hypothetical protein MUK42_20348 [Musa troglodytarum]|uniref:Uncharacterized protein n=1 Tax=Musa troglodytarum TaxID=320322 RepID=A0A9E7G1C2_9LILI|nr:hypothetical protein MUK42_20348 [Musa troglodytarum]